VSASLRQLAGTRAGAGARRLATRLLSGRERDVRVLSGPLRGTRLRLDLGQEKSFWAGVYEPDVQRLLAELAPAGVAFDVGANIGYFSLLLARSARLVVAVEPVAANAARIRASAALNGAAIEVVEAAALDRSGSVRIELGPTSATAKVAGVDGPGWLEPGRGNADVAAVRLDDLAARFGRPELVKLDVEGAAGLVLAGAANVLAARPTLLCELHGRAETDAVRAAAAAAGLRIAEVGDSWLLARPE
jgi:FkbM family methyltransferase